MTEKLPYIVSADAEHLTMTWARRAGLKVPDTGFFTDFEDGLVEQLNSAGTDFTTHILPHGVLAHGLQSLIFNHSRGDAVALDRAYVGDDFARHLEVTRAVGPNLQSIGTRRRPHTPSIDEQIDYIVANSSRELTLVDDVVFSGDAVLDVVKLFEEKGAFVKTVLAAVTVGEGRTKIEQRGIEVVSVVDYEDVKDEVCERDFLAGVPYSGRTVYTLDERHYSAPYFSPFGLPEQWASIEGEGAVGQFSNYCLAKSIEFWRKVEQMNDKNIPHAVVPRPLELRPSENVSIVEYLEQKRADLS